MAPPPNSYRRSWETVSQPPNNKGYCGVEEIVPTLGWPMAQKFACRKLAFLDLFGPFGLQVPLLKGNGSTHSLK